MKLDLIKDKTRLTFEQASAVWRADPETGLLHWLEASGRTGAVRVGRAGQKPSYYLQVRYEGFTYAVHRLAWLLYTGKWPEFFIDHINGDRHDNRLVNLRDVTHQVNQQNQKCHREGTKKADYRTKAPVTLDPSIRYETAPSRYKVSVTPRARTPLLTERMSQRNAVTPAVTRDAVTVTRDSDSYGLRPTPSPSRPEPSTAPKTDFEAECKAIAKRVLAERDQGWPVDEQRIRWAELTLSGKQLVLVWTARDEAVLVERAGVSAPGMYRYVDGELVELPTTRARLSDH